MISAIIVIFIVAYAAIALEHPIKINKSASALVGAGVLWTVYAAFGGDHALIGNQLDESVTSTAKIVFFLIGAMTIVEVIDAHNGFEVITSLIRTRKQVTLMWIVCFVTFFLSAVLDNLTTTIVMISLMKKISDKPGRSPVFRVDDRDRRQRRRRLVGDRRRDDHHALDRWADHAARHHRWRVACFAGQPARSASGRELSAQGQAHRCRPPSRRARRS